MSDSGRTMRPHCDMCGQAHHDSYEEVVVCRARIFQMLAATRNSAKPLAEYDPECDDDSSEWGEDRTGND